MLAFAVPTLCLVLSLIHVELIQYQALKHEITLWYSCVTLWHSQITIFGTYTCQMLDDVKSVTCTPYMIFFVLFLNTWTCWLCFNKTWTYSSLQFLALVHSIASWFKILSLKHLIWIFVSSIWTLEHDHYACLILRYSYHDNFLHLYISIALRFKNLVTLTS